MALPPEAYRSELETNNHHDRRRHWTGHVLEQPDGSVTGGAVFLDHTFDREDSRRRLLRIHELGHALGYRHVRRKKYRNFSVGSDPHGRRISPPQNLY